MKGNQVNWNQVFYFCQIARHGSIKLAAEELGLTSPTLSEHLNQLEKSLQVTLFHRKHRRLVLTPQGSRLFQHAKQMFEAGQRLIDVVSPLSLGSYPISIGVVPGPFMPLANRLLTRVEETHGPVSMRVGQADYESLERGLTNASFDFGFADRAAERPGLRHRLIIASRIRLYVAPKWASTPMPELMERLPLLQYRADPGSRSFTDHLLAEFETAPRAYVTSEYPSLLQHMCERGQGIGVFNEASVRASKAILEPLPLPESALKLEDRMYALWSEDAESSVAVQHLLDQLQSFSAESEPA